MTLLKSISRRSHPQQLFEYVFNPAKLLRDSNGQPIVISHNIRQRQLSPLAFAKEFAENEHFRLRTRKDMKILEHLILAWSPLDKEKITPGIIRDIANKYIELRGKDNLYVGTVHSAEHIHLHIIVSPLKYMSGESSRVSRSEFHNIKLELDRFQREKYFDELENSFPNHGRVKMEIEQVKENQFSIKRNERVNNKERLIKILDASFKNSNTKDNFLLALEEQGHIPYYRNGKLTGVRFNGEEKFRLNRLGYDNKKLDEIENRDHEHSIELQQIKSLREAHFQEQIQSRSLSGDELEKIDLH